MTKSATILSVPAMVSLRQQLRQATVRVGLCHGCFDILHAGHVHHLTRAAELVDVLVVSVTPARYVNKGVGRPVFDDAARLAVLAALRPVDYVVLNDAPTAVPMILRLEPDVYIKGAHYGEGEDGRLAEELRALKEVGGSFELTDDEVFDSSSRAAAALVPPT